MKITMKNSATNFKSKILIDPLLITSNAEFQNSSMHHIVPKFLAGFEAGSMAGKMMCQRNELGLLTEL